MSAGPVPQPFISLRNVAIRLHERVLFQGTCWEIAGDQHWAVVGPNGAGKSTLLRALAGRLPVVRGEIVYHFAPLGSCPYHAIAYVDFDAQRRTLADQDPFYQARWHSERSREGPTLAEFLARDADVTDGSARADVLGPLGLDGLLERTLVQLSSGERRKALIARALVGSPGGAVRLLILDNPFAGLDGRSRVALREALERLIARGGMRLIVAAPAGDDVPAGITHVARVEGGQVVQQEALTYARAVRAPAAAHSGTRPAARTPPCPGGEILVHMQGVRVAYNGTAVLEAVDWTVRAGEHWALVGPNGAGKTTLLGLLLGDHPQAYANAITLFGRRRGTGESIWEIKQQVGWVAPELHLYYPPEMSCLDVVCSGLHDSVGLFRHPAPAEREVAAATLARLGLGAWASVHSPVPFARLSEGEQRLVLVARALVKRPRLLVLDEPCQGLDAANRARVLEAVDALADGPGAAPTVIYVTHDGVFPRLITHVLRLERGRVVETSRVWETPEVSTRTGGG